MTTSYGHFCLAARTLERVGDRWSLLIVRDLISGPRRFSDLRRLLTNVTPKWLTIRLRQLEADGVVERHHEPGRREVWYELTEKGRELAPVIEALLGWGLKHERHALAADEATHAEHLMAGIVVALNERARGSRRSRMWRFEFDDPERSFDLAYDGTSWSRDGAYREPDVVVSTTARALVELVTTSPAKRRLPSREIRLAGEPDRVAELVGTLGPTAARSGSAGRRSPGPTRA
jgi:DNA-binding HxlR family transcriptional regulator